MSSVIAPISRHYAVNRSDLTAPAAFRAERRADAPDAQTIRGSQVVTARNARGEPRLDQPALAWADVRGLAMNGISQLARERSLVVAKYESCGIQLTVVRLVCRQSGRWSGS